MAAAVAELGDINPNNVALYRQLDEYPWDEDDEFQGGLRAILGPVQDTDQVNHLTLRAKCYYYARKSGIPVDFDGYKQWVEARSAGLPINGTRNDVSVLESSEVPPSGVELQGGGATGATAVVGEPPKPASFAEICEMIAEGKPVPGIKDIPDTILEGQASESHHQKRKKPWETTAESSTVEQPSWMR